MMLPGKAYMIGRAEVPNPADRPKFEEWYTTNHLPLAVEKLKAERGWRFWSRTDPAVHYAMYQFPDMDFLQERMNSDDLRFLIADFDKTWPSGVTRTRDFVELVQEISSK